MARPWRYPSTIFVLLAIEARCGRTQQMPRYYNISTLYTTYTPCDTWGMQSSRSSKTPSTISPQITDNSSLPQPSNPACNRGTIRCISIMYLTCKIPTPHAFQRKYDKLAHQHVLAGLDVGLDDLLPVGQHPLQGRRQRLGVRLLLRREVSIPAAAGQFASISIAQARPSTPTLHRHRYTRAEAWYCMVAGARAKSCRVISFSAFPPSTRFG